MNLYILIGLSEGSIHEVIRILEEGGDILIAIGIRAARPGRRRVSCSAVNHTQLDDWWGVNRTTVISNAAHTGLFWFLSDNQLVVKSISVGGR
jgi:hypothetical protein